MHPKPDAEKIRFRKEADSGYRLVHEGTLDGSSNLSYIVRLVEGEMGIKLERKGYFGQGRYSCQTLQSDRPINTRVFGRRFRRLFGLSLQELAAVVRARRLLARKSHNWIEQRSGESVRRLDITQPNENTTHRFF